MIYCAFEEGEVVDFANFLRCDINKDDVLTSEFVDAWWNSETEEQDFESFDVDGNGAVNLSEFAKKPGPYLRNPRSFSPEPISTGTSGLDRTA